jgi:hypothetical protein
MKNERGNRDIIVIGGSAGALEPMKHLMAAFPADLRGGHRRPGARRHIGQGGPWIARALQLPGMPRPLWEIADPALLRYRCHVGHAFAAETLVEAQARKADQTLQSLVRLTRERAELVQRLARERREGTILSWQLRCESGPRNTGMMPSCWMDYCSDPRSAQASHPDRWKN